MDDKLGWIKILLLSGVIAVGIFLIASLDRSQEELIEIRKQVTSQGKVLSELGISQGRLKQQLEKIEKKFSTGISFDNNTKANENPDPVGWVPDGLILSHGKNCLLDPKTIVDPFPQAKDSDTLNLFMQTDVNDMNGLLENSAVLRDIEDLVKMGLYGRQFMQPGEKFYGGLAKTLRVSGDFKVYTFELRDDLYWHNPAVDLNDPKFKWIRNLGPQKVTARDFEFTVMDLVLNPDTQCDVLRSYLDKLDKVVALDDFTLQVIWKEKYFPSLTTSSFGSVLPEFLYSRYENGKKIPREILGEVFNKHWYNDKIIGCGPYRFVSYTKGKRVVLERNESFPLRKPHFKNVIFHIIKDSEQRLQRFKNGKLDFIEIDANRYTSEIFRPGQDPSLQEGNPFYNGEAFWKMVETPGYSYIGWNQNREVFKDQKVRQALTHALPVRRLLRDVWMGFGEEITGPIHKFSPDYNKSLSPIDFDLKKAARLLKEAGWEDRDGDGLLEKELGGKIQNLEFEVIHYSPMPEYDQMFAVYSKELLKIGVRLKSSGLNWPTLIKRIEERQFDAAALAWLLVYDTDPYQIWHSSQADNPKGSNRIGYKNATVDALIEEARRTFDPKERSKIFHQFHQIMYDEQPYTLWRARKTVYAWSRRLGKDIRFDTRRPQYSPTEWWDHDQSSRAGEQ